MERRNEKKSAELKDENELSLRRQQTALHTPEEIEEGQPAEQENVNIDVETLTDTIYILETTDRILSSHRSQLTQLLLAYDDDVKKIRGQLASITVDLKRKLCGEKPSGMRQEQQRLSPDFTALSPLSKDSWPEWSSSSDEDLPTRINTAQSRNMEIAEEPQPGPSGMRQEQQRLSPDFTALSPLSKDSWPEWSSSSDEDLPTSRNTERRFEGVRRNQQLLPERPAKRRRPDSPAVWF